MNQIFYILDKKIRKEKNEDEMRGGVFEIVVKLRKVKGWRDE